MVRAAIEGERGFEMDEVEILRGGTSYTIDTALHLRALYPEADLFYLIGEDNLAELHTWRRVDELLLPGATGRHGARRRTGRRTRTSRCTSGGSIFRPPIYARRIAKGQSIRYLVPDKVRAIIENHQLYREGLSS